jgi:ubiquinone/menaquinone biosynthesis C-methylase UbiE
MGVFASLHYLRHLARLGTSDIHPGGSHASLVLMEALQPSAGQILLELGCGAGNTMRRLVDEHGVRVVGLDLLPEMLMAARHRLEASLARGRCALVRADASRLPFQAQSFDGVYSESVLGIQTEVGTQALLSEVFRVLRPNGLFIANEAIWRSHVDQPTATRVNQQCELDFGLPQAAERAWSVDQWLGAMRAAGFRPLSWNQIAERPQHQSLGVDERWARRLRLLFSPTLLRDHYRYRRRQARHQDDRLLIEARLFVSARPE